MTDTPNKSEVAELLDEAGELLGRYSGAVDGTWERNLETIGLLMVVHLAQLDRHVSYMARMRESMIFLRTAFRMGTAATREETNNES